MKKTKIYLTTFNSIAVGLCMNFQNPDKSNLYYYNASNFIKTLVQSNISKVIPHMPLLDINVYWCKEAEILEYPSTIEWGAYKGYEDFLDSDFQAIEENMILVAPVKLCDYRRSRMEMMETLKGFLEDVVPRRS